MTNKNKGISKIFLTVIASFVQEYEAAAFALSKNIFATKRGVKAKLNKLSDKMLNGIIDDMFTEGIRASNKIMKREVSNLVSILDQPFKYTKDVINTINDNSVFTGFYDTKYNGLYKKREIDALKRKILTGKYAGWSDTKLAKEIRSVIDISKNRALITARMETQRLEGAAQQAFYDKAVVRNKFKKVYITRDDDRVREKHKILDGQIADDEGYFTDASGNKFQYPPPPDSTFGCRCRAEMIERTEKERKEYINRNK